MLSKRSTSHSCHDSGIKLLSLDFDDTCTSKDTTSLFYKATNKYRFGTKEEKRRLDEQWSKHAEEYGTGLVSVQDKAFSRLEGSTTSPGFNDKGLREFLKTIGEFGLNISRNVESDGLLQGITSEGIQAVAKDVELQHSCLETLSHFRNCQVISINWSSEIIYFKLGIERARIHANSFPVKDGKSTGKIDRTMRTAFDKERVFKKLVNESRSQGVTIFIGDSLTDLLALLAADFGIIVGQSRSLRKVLGVSGISLRPLSEVNDTNCSRASHTLYEACSWMQIQSFLNEVNSNESKKIKNIPESSEEQHIEDESLS